MLKNPAFVSLIDNLWVSDLTWVLRNSRDWFNREYYSHRMHSAVVDAFQLANPKDWHLVVLQWPHASEGDSSRIAYTQDEKKGEANRQTVTSIGKYLTRHWGGILPDHEIARIVANNTGSGFEFRRGKEALRQAVQQGPTSCMKMSEHTLQRLGGHPYDVYEEQFGWHIAVRMDGRDIVSRCLCCDDENGKRFVRTYSKPSSDSSYSQRDNQMEEWLKRQGYTHADSWEDSKVAMIGLPHGGGYLMPYLDGDVQQASARGYYFLIDSNGEFSCDHSDGTTADNRRECEHCGDMHDEDDGFWIGPNEDAWVGNCCEDEYTCVHGPRRWQQYYINSSDAVEVNGEYYDSENLPDCIVMLSNGYYSHIDEAFCCAVDGEWYSKDEGVHAEDLDALVHEDNAWQCDASANWYSDNQESIRIDGGTYHPDHAPEEDIELSDCLDVIVVSEPVCLHASTFESVQLDNTIEWMTRPTIRQRPSLMDLFCKAANIPDQQTVELRNQHFADIRGWDTGTVTGRLVESVTRQIQERASLNFTRLAEMRNEVRARMLTAPYGGKRADVLIMDDPEWPEQRIIDSMYPATMTPYVTMPCSAVVKINSGP